MHPLRGEGGTRARSKAGSEAQRALRGARRRARRGLGASSTEVLNHRGYPAGSFRTTLRMKWWDMMSEKWPGSSKPNKENTYSHIIIYDN